MDLDQRGPLKKLYLLFYFILNIFSRLCIEGLTHVKTLHCKKIFLQWYLRLKIIIPKVCLHTFAFASGKQVFKLVYLIFIKMMIVSFDNIIFLKKTVYLPRILFFV